MISVRNSLMIIIQAIVLSAKSETGEFYSTETRLLSAQRK